MKLRCMLRLCSYGPWRSHDADFLDARDGEVIRRHYLKRECRNCGRRQERSVRDNADSRAGQSRSPTHFRSRS